MSDESHNENLKRTFAELGWDRPGLAPRDRLGGGIVNQTRPTIDPGIPPELFDRACQAMQDYSGGFCHSGLAAAIRVVMDHYSCAHERNVAKLQDLADEYYTRMMARETSIQEALAPALDPKGWMPR